MGKEWGPLQNSFMESYKGFKVMSATEPNSRQEKKITNTMIAQ